MDYVVQKLGALILTRDGLGGGVISALLPKSYEELYKLIQLDRTNQLVEKRIRSNKVYDRQKGRETVLNDHAFVAKLAILYATENPKHFTVAEFANWISVKLDKKDMLVRRIAIAHGLNADNLAERRPNWWKQIIAQRRKAAKNES
jgi:hypothetical protein